MNKILLIIVTLHLSVTQAVADFDLYSGEVVVASQTEADRNQAAPEALLQVLQKLSGQREIPASPALDQVLDNTSSLLRSYRYTRVEHTGVDGEVSEELRLVAQFMQSEVDRVVQQLGLPRWPQERAEVQLWVVIDDGLNRELKPLEFAYAWEFMEEVAVARGLPVGWPELDEEEVQLVDMRLVWGGFTDYLVERGAPDDGVAIIAARREGPQWVVRWNLASGGQSSSWQSSDVELMYALAEGMNLMADQVAAGNVIAASDQRESSIDLTIGGLNSADAYVDCLDYLQNLSLVDSVEVLGASPGLVSFRLQLNASAEHLTEAFELGSELLPASAGSDFEYEFLH